MSTPLFLQYALEFAVQYKYLLIFLGAIIEGPLLMIACGFFLRFGSFDLVPLYFTLVLGDLVADVGWYYAGYFFADPIVRRHGKFFGITPDIYERVKILLRKYQNTIFFLSKVTLGFGLALAMVIVAGAIHVPFKKYLTLNAIGELILVAVLLSVGFFFGNTYNSIAGNFKLAFLVGGVLFAVLLIFGLSKYVRKKAMEMTD